MFYGLDIAENTKEAAKYFKISANNGNSDSMFYYGMMLYKGDGIIKNTKEAVKFIKKSADLENKLASFYYGIFLYLGYSTKKNKMEALKYFKISADKGFNDAMFIYGILLYKDLDPTIKKEGALYIEMATKEYSDYSTIDLNIINPLCMIQDIYNTVFSDSNKKEYISLMGINKFLLFH